MPIEERRERYYSLNRGAGSVTALKGAAQNDRKRLYHNFNNNSMKKNIKQYQSRLGRWLSFVIATVLMVVSGGGAFAMADEPAIQNPVGNLDGPGSGVEGAKSRTEAQAIMEDQKKDLDYYVKQIDKRICEMKLESCPIDQILRSASRTNHAISMVVKYYEIGQRPIYTKLATKVAATATGAATEISPENKACFDSMDTILFPQVMGYKSDGTTRETSIPLMVRVVNQSAALNPIVIAVNGKKNSTQNNRWDLPDLPQGTPMLRLGRAAAETDVETASYYSLPDPSEQYCQRFIMQVEETIIERMSTKVVDWDFSKQERIAMDDMRGGMERSGLFGIKGVSRYGKTGNVYTTGGIYWLAGKDITLGHWAPKTEKAADGTEKPVTVTVDAGKGDGTTVTKTVYEYVISEKELTSFVNLAIQDAGNGSRTKLLFVDNLIYQALSNLKSTRRIIMQTETNYQNWGLDFESFNSMGTKIMIYRHDAFNYMGMNGFAFLLDPRYLEKWVFGNWERKEYNLKDLFIRNSNAVVMEEFSCWTLYFPAAHARVNRPTFDTTKGVTDEVKAA